MTDSEKTEMNPDELKKLNDLKQLIADLNDLPSPTFVEKNFFNIGGRSFYENPISNVLAFFCHSDGEHGFGDLVVRALFKALNIEPSNSEGPTKNGNLSGNNESKQSLRSYFATINDPEREGREVSTAEGNRIDLLLEGDDWVMVIENKIYHHQENNPFGNYMDYVNKEEKKRFDGKSKFFVVLSPGGTAKENWHGLSYAAFIEQIKNELGRVVLEQPMNKWLVLLREFIINLQEFTMTNPTPPETIKYIAENIEKIKSAEAKTRETLHAFMEEIRKKVEEKLVQQIPSAGGVYAKLDGSWQYPAPHFRISRWIAKSFAVVLYPDGKGSSEPQNGPLSVWFGIHFDNDDQCGRAMDALKEDGEKPEKEEDWLWTESDRRFTTDQKDEIAEELTRRLKQLIKYEKVVHPQKD